MSFENCAFNFCAFRPFWRWKLPDEADPEAAALWATTEVDESKVIIGGLVALTLGEFDGLFSLIIAGEGETAVFPAAVAVEDFEQSTEVDLDTASVANEDFADAVDLLLPICLVDFADAVALLLPICLVDLDVAVEDLVFVDVIFDEALPLPTPGSDVISVN